MISIMVLTMSHASHPNAQGLSGEEKTYQFEWYGRKVAA
jgi:hypothetical protein